MLLISSCLLLPLSGAAQELDRVEELALSGRTEQAREALTTWWEAKFGEGTRIDRQRGFWLRGILTVDPELAALDFQRLVVEYPGGPFTAQALVRLGGAAEARADLERAEGHFRTLRRDYPGGEYETLAQAWLDSHGKGAADPPLLTDSGGEDPAPAVRPSPSTGRYAVQLGAFSSETRALTLSRTATKAGFNVRIVRVEGNDLFRVRLGRFSTQDDAEAEMARVTGSGFEAAVVRNADREVT